MERQWRQPRRGLRQTKKWNAKITQREEEEESEPNPWCLRGACS
jgi:hypothetical protein